MRAVVLVLLALLVQAGQPAALLRITVSVPDAGGQPRPVPRHALLISDNPVTAAPQRAVTNIDGIAEIRLAPGNYTVESDQPFIFGGQSYQWSQTLDVAAGGTTTVALTAENAMIEAAGGASPAANAASTAAAILLDWKDSVFTVWTPTHIGAGCLVDARGLVATSGRLVGNATDVEVQISAALKVPGRVVAADTARDVAIVWIDPAALDTVKPVRLAAGGAAIAEGGAVFAVEPSLRERPTLSTGTVTRLAAHTITSDIHIDRRDAGVPLFDASGTVVGLTRPRDEGSDGPMVSPRAVRIEDAQPALAEARTKMKGQRPPSGTLPLDPYPPLAEATLRQAVSRRAGSLSAYMVPASDFDVALITPLLVYGAQHRGDRLRTPGNPAQLQPALRALDDFANWSDYVSDYLPVLLVRVTPKLSEAFWATLARGAASTQGVTIPPIKHLKAGFLRLRAFCGDAEVAPIHPLRIERRLDERTVIGEGLYAFDPAAFAGCRAVTLALYSDKAPAKPDTRVVDAATLRQAQDDFAAVR